MKRREAKAEEARLEFVEAAGQRRRTKAGTGRPPASQQVARQKWNRLQAEVVAFTDPAVTGDVALGVRDGKTIADTEIRIRGEAEKLGPGRPRGYPSLLTLPNAAPIPADQSGRLQLAEWMTRADNPLTSRVVVNRVWQHLFGKGLVSTVDNFGVNGDLRRIRSCSTISSSASRAKGGPCKKLVRTLVLTRAYGLSGHATEAHLVKDPANRLLWRHSPRRLTAEELRDAALVASNQLNRTPPEDTPSKSFRVIELPNNGPQARGLDTYSRARQVPERLPAAPADAGSAVAGSLRLCASRGWSPAAATSRRWRRRPSIC